MTAFNTVKWSHRVLLASSFSLLGYCGFVLVDNWLFQRREGVELDQRLLTHPPKAASHAEPAASGGLMGRLEIPRLGMSVIMVEGTSYATLQRAVGHIAGTAQPGQAGNVGISGHRDTFFRPLRKIHPDDVITLTTLAGKFNYRVVSTRIVDPSEVSVLEAGTSESLTLVTCYPFYFVGPAPDRFIVRAERLI